MKTLKKAKKLKMRKKVKKQIGVMSSKITLERAVNQKKTQMLMND